MDRNLVFVKGSHWKASRSCMSQFFSNAKLKTVMPSVHDAMRQLLEVLGEHVDRGVEVDINTYCERFTFDVISKAAFSIDTGVQRNPNHPMFLACLATFPNFMRGFFYRMGQSFYHWPWVIKSLQKLIDLLYHNPLAASTLESLKIMNFRYENPQGNITDMAQLLLDEALGKKEGAPKKEGIPAPVTQEKMIEVATNAMDIFLGGYDTSRLTLTSWFFLMGKHPDVQEKMRKEILEAYKNEGEFLSIKTLQSLQYTNQVINETLRMFPPVVTFTTRRADQDHRCGKYLIKKGTSVMVPTYQLHHDPELWTDPEKFDPDRFSPENKHLINPVAYQPFGYGVRMCVGMRLALLELASVTSQTLRRFRIELGSTQKRDLELYTYAFLAAPKEKVWIRLHRLNGVK
ncbi:hypothetical protein V5799_007345 [Amblyomma americanum]|uniref:Cytochrome n=1 Tax=Amblyomma americanum TaxID=6943 RepID=A0AAQ4DTT4_AMBAM